MNLIIEESDFDFYQNLPTEEKFIFLYDLLCTDFYDSDLDDTESITVENDTQRPIKTLTYFTEEDLMAFETKISSIIEASIVESSNVNVAMLSDILVFNADDIESIRDVVLIYALNGLILTELELKDSLQRMFKKKPACQIYFLIGKDRKIQLN